MSIWSAEIKELERLYDSFKGQLPELEKELGHLIHSEDRNVILLYSRRCLEVIITDLCECELRRERGTEPLKGIIDKLNKEKKIPHHIIASIHSLNELSTFGTHPKDFDPEQIKPALINLDIIIKWYLKYKDLLNVGKQNSEQEKVKNDKSEVTESVKSIAVLPFKDMSPEKDQDYFCEGMAEEIINVLAHIEDFKVIARTSAFAFKEKQVDIREIGRILDVETLLEGSVRKSGDRIRITAQLIRVADSSHIWSERYDRELKDVFAIQDEIALAITNNLKVKLLDEKKALISKRHSRNLVAFDFYLKFMHWFQMQTEEGFRRAKEYCDLALENDPDYALAYIGLAYVNAVRPFWVNLSPNIGFPKAIEYVNKALKLDITLPDAYHSLGFINTIYYWNWREAERNYKHAIELNPGSSFFHMDYSYLLTFTGRNEEAIQEAERAKELDPLSPFIIGHCGNIYRFAGQLERSIEQNQMALTIDPNYFVPHFHLGITYSLKGMSEKTKYEYEKAVNLSGGNSFITAALICNYYRIGKKDEADELFESLKKRLETEYIPATSFYLIHRFRGEEVLAYEWLKRACDEHDTFLPYLRVEPAFLPKGSKYMQLLKERGLDY
ncbi:MAG: hypothetical protein JXB49_35090 [Bacteroidales bacterium]|nr:hypothetical protein [Bacteroidales bacterium]